MDTMKIAVIGGAGLAVVWYMKQKQAAAATTVTPTIGATAPYSQASTLAGNGVLASAAPTTSDVSKYLSAIATAAKNTMSAAPVIPVNAQVASAPPVTSTSRGEGYVPTQTEAYLGGENVPIPVYQAGQYTGYASGGELRMYADGSVHGAAGVNFMNGAGA